MPAHPCGEAMAQEAVLEHMALAGRTRRPAVGGAGLAVSQSSPAAGFDVTAMVLLFLAALQATLLSAMGHAGAAGPLPLRLIARAVPGKARLLSKRGSAAPALRPEESSPAPECASAAAAPGLVSSPRPSPRCAVSEVLDEFEATSATVSARRIGEGGKVEYQVDVVIGVVALRSWRRYSELRAFRDEVEAWLAVQMPAGSAWVERGAPAFPSRVRNAGDLEERQRVLAAYLRALLTPAEGLLDAITVGRLLRRHAAFLHLPPQVLAGLSSATTRIIRVLEPIAK